MTVRAALGAGLGALVGTSIARVGFGWLLDVDGTWLVVLIIASGLLGSAVGVAAALERRQKGATEPVTAAAGRASARPGSAARAGGRIGAWIGRAAFKWILDVDGTLLVVLMAGCAAIGGVLFALGEREQAHTPAGPSRNPSAE